MKKVNPKYLIIAAIVLIALIVVIIIGVGKGKDTPVKDNDVTGTNIDETIPSDVTNESDTNREIVDTSSEDISSDTEEEMPIIINTEVEIKDPDANLSESEIQAKKDYINSNNKYKFDNMTDNEKAKYIEDNKIYEIPEDYTGTQIIDLNGLYAEFSGTKIYFNDKQNTAKYKTDIDHGLELWKAYNFIYDDAVIAKIYGEKYILKSIDWFQNDIFETYTSLGGMQIGEKLDSTTTELDNYIITAVDGISLDGDKVSNIIITPNTKNLKVGDEIYTYSVSIICKDIEEIDIIRSKLEIAVNKLLNTDKLTISL